MFVSYIGKEWLICGFIGLVGWCIFALTNYNNKQIKIYNYDNCKQF